MNIQIELLSQDYWFQIVDFLQQNWTLIEPNSNGEGCTVCFLSETSGLFDELAFSSVGEAEHGLKKNGFKRYKDDPSAQGMFQPPLPPYVKRSHPNGPIYSSGRFWKD